MKWMKKMHRSLLLLSVMVLMFGQTAFAQEPEKPLYYYTVRVSAGDMGTFKDGAKDSISVTRDGVENPEGTKKDYIGDQIVITGLRYGDVVWTNPQEIAKEKDEKYSVRGVRRSGRDNLEAVSPTFDIASDMDYVIAYRVDGDSVKYTVNYQDEAGNALLDSIEYHGNVNEEQIVSARYVDGYLPQAYNLSKTLRSNEAENVFTFIYTPVETPGTTVVEEGGTTTTTTETTGAGAAGTGAAGAGAGAAGAGAGAAGADAGAAGADAGVGGDVAAVPDEGVPLDDGPEDLQNLDDEDVPLANVNQERPGKVVSYLPVYIGIGAAAAIALAATAIYLRKRRRVPAKEIVEKIRNDEIK